MLLHRLSHMVLVFWMFITLLFFMMQLAPGDIVTTMVRDPRIPPEARDALREQFGLDQPLFVQYLDYLQNFVTGNLGVSFSHYPTPVMEIVLNRMPRTIVLFLAAVLLAYAMGFVAGKLLAWRRGGIFEYGTTVTGVLLYTVFYPWFAIMMLLIFGSVFELVPLRGFIDTDLWSDAPYSSTEVFWYIIVALTVLTAVVVAVRLLTARMNDYAQARTAAWGGCGVAFALFCGYWWLSPMSKYALDIAHHAVLPIVTLALVNFGGAMLLTRTSMLETLREDYIFTARAKGLSEREVRDRHAARTALMPVVTSLVIQLAYVIGGGVVTETVFSWDGIGRTLVTAVQQQDTPLVVGAFAFLGVTVLIGHLVIDVVCSLLDPRIRVS
ncbi:MAG: ABC transporter permease [Streptosporangiales bacterium]